MKANEAFNQASKWQSFKMNA